MPRFRSVVFDCDSTLSAIEGIDELAIAHREEIGRLTDAAMRGEVPLEDVYGRRLALVKPTREAVDALGALYVERLVPDAREVVAALQAEGIDVRIVSGGLRPAVLAAARAVGVRDDAVEAVDVYFDSAGHYAGFDEQSPLARAGGKRVVLERWTELPRPVMFVGDGVTDLEARPVVDCFVAFAGVVERAAVVAAADAVVRSASLAPVLALALDERRPADAHAAALFDRGASLMARS